MEDLTKINWDKILKALARKRCVLFLGKGAYEAAGGGDIEKALMEHLQARNDEDPEIKMFYPDGFYLLNNKFSRDPVIDHITEFYNQSFAKNEANFQILAQIPFTMIFSMAPDNFLVNAYNACGMDYTYDFFNQFVPETFKTPTIDKPLIYNLFGNIDHPESLILTHQDLFNYLQMAFEGNRIHIDLTYQLEKEISNFIFLGLPFEKWYFQLLLRVLALHTDKFKDVERLALDNFDDQKMLNLYTEEFDINFIQSDVTSFLTELHRQCKEKGLLKEKQEVSAGSNLFFRSIKELIRNNNLEGAFSQLNDYVDSDSTKYADQRNMLIIIESQYSDLLNDFNSGILTRDEAEISKNKTKYSLIQFIDKIQELS